MTSPLFFISHTEKAAADIHRTLMPNGTAFVTTWELLGHVQYFSPHSKPYDSISPSSLDPFRSHGYYRRS